MADHSIWLPGKPLHPLQAILTAAGNWHLEPIAGAKEAFSPNKIDGFPSLQVTTPAQARLMELEAEVARLKAMLNAVDDGSCAAEPEAGLVCKHGAAMSSACARCVEEFGPSAMDEAQANRTPVDHVIDMLDKRVIVTPDRTRLRKALDKADAPLGGRAGADAGLGRAIGKPSTFAAGVYVGR